MFNMSTDRESLQEYLDHVSDKYYAFEIIERLEEAGLITVQDVIARFEEEIIEGKEVLSD